MYKSLKKKKKGPVLTKLVTISCQETKGGLVYCSHQKSVQGSNPTTKY